METENRQGTANTQPGEEGRGGGTGLAAEEDRELPVLCLHRHPHTNRTLDSLSNVDRPLPRGMLPHRIFFCLGDEPLRRRLTLTLTAVGCSSSSIPVGAPVDPPVWGKFFFGALGDVLFVASSST